MLGGSRRRQAVSVSPRGRHSLSPEGWSRTDLILFFFFFYTVTAGTEKRNSSPLLSKLRGDSRSGIQPRPGSPAAELRVSVLRRCHNPDLTQHTSKRPLCEKQCIQNEFICSPSVAFRRRPLGCRNIKSGFCFCTAPQTFLHVSIRLQTTNADGSRCGGSQDPPQFLPPEGPVVRVGVCESTSRMRMRKIVPHPHV